MDPNVRELADLLVRWIHVIAGIMWVGNSMLFNWLDRNLEQRKGLSDKSFGEIWMLHSGAYYQVEKKMLRPEEFPKILHWFKWQSYTTWISGISLLLIVYYGSGGGSYLVDPNVSKISPDQAMDFGLLTVFGGFIVYDVIWRTLGKHAERVATALTVALVAAAVWFVPHVLEGRSAFIHVGAMLGTIMAGNVFFHIVPSQRQLVAATKKGGENDLSLSKHAKQRSIHNNYFTFPLIFLMISNHFPGTFSGKHSSIVLAVFIVAGALVRHFMNIRFTFRPWFPYLAGTVVAAVTAIFFLVRVPKAAATAAPREKIAFSRVELIMQTRCVPCHSRTPSDPSMMAAPNGVMFDTPEQIKGYAEKIKLRAVISKNMPLANKTSMTEEERDVLGKWLLGGASID
jgi:uncharacterized membrane protein